MIDSSGVEHKVPNSHESLAFSPNLGPVLAVHEALGKIARGAEELGRLIDDPETILSGEERERLQAAQAQALGALTTGYAFLSQETSPKDPDSIHPLTNGSKGSSIERIAAQPTRVLLVLPVPHQNGNGSTEGPSQEIINLGTSPNENLREIAQTKIIPVELLPEIPIPPDEPIQAAITADNTLVIGDIEITLNSPDELAIFNGLLLNRNEARNAAAVREAGFAERRTRSATSQAFSMAIRAVEKKLNSCGQDKILLRTGQKGGTRYQLTPKLVVEDLRQQSQPAQAGSVKKK